MKIALFAPGIAPTSGGIWQYYQWVSRYLGGEFPFLLFAPSELLQEIMTLKNNEAKQVAADDFISRVERTALYKVLDGRQKIREGKLSGLPGRILAGFTRKYLLHGNVTEHAVFRMLKKETVDIIHNPGQHLQMRSVVKRFPFIINPHDYQHEHFPDFFTPEQHEYRRTVWYQDQRNAGALVVHSRQTQADACHFLGVPEERIFYAPYGPLDTFPDPDAETLQLTRKKFRLPERFIFYPARTWPHKNHLALLQAVKRLQKGGIDVNLVFTVVDDEHGAKVRHFISDDGLDERVTITGRVSPETMGALYRLSSMVVIPSLFEQNSGPLLEAIHYGRAVAVSRLDEIEQSLNGAGILFDPRSTDEIADAIDELWTSADTLEKWESRIRTRRNEMSWKPFLEAYRRAYAYALR